MHEGETEGCDADGRQGFHGGEPRAPTRQQRQGDPPASKRRGGYCQRRRTGNFACTLSLKAAGRASKQRHVGSRWSKPQRPGARTKYRNLTSNVLQHKQLRDRDHVFAKFFPVVGTVGTDRGCVPEQAAPLPAFPSPGQAQRNSGRPGRSDKLLGFRRPQSGPGLGSTRNASPAMPPLS
jgi:hypothetical protein